MASVRVDYCERQPAFGHFETVRLTGTRILRWLAYLALTGVLGATVATTVAAIVTAICAV